MARRSSLVRLAPWVAWLLVLTACQPSVAREPSPPPSAASPATWNPDAWRPPIPVQKAPPLEPGEAEARRIEWLKEIAEESKISLPDPVPPLKRWILDEEQGEVWGACLREQGWAASGGADGSLHIEGDIPKDQQQAFDAALLNCQAQYSLDPRLFRTPSATDLTVMWYYFHDYGVPCLAAHGYSPEVPLPTLETFVASSGDWGLWPPPPPLMPDDVQRACPENVRSSVLLGN